MPIKICLLGSIPKGDMERADWKDWKIAYKKILQEIPDVEFIDGDAWKDESNPQLTVGHDAFMVKQADIIVVNAETKLGAGTAQEMVIAKYFKKPLVAILPKGTHHRKSNIVFHGQKLEDWIHPFILTFADYIADSIDDATRWIGQNIKNSQLRIKGIEVIDDAIQAYKDFLNK